MKITKRIGCWLKQSEWWSIIVGWLEVMVMTRKLRFLGLLCRVGDGGWGYMVNMSVA